MGQALRLLLSAVMEEKVANDRQLLLQYLRQSGGGGPGHHNKLINALIRQISPGEVFPFPGLIAIMKQNH